MSIFILLNNFFYNKIVARVINKSNKYLYFYFQSKPKFHKKNTVHEFSNVNAIKRAERRA